MQLRLALVASLPADEPYAASTQSGQLGADAPFFAPVLPAPGAPLAATAAGDGTAETGPCEVVFDDASTSSSR